MDRRTTTDARPHGVLLQRLLRFSAVSGVAIVITQILLQSFYRFTPLGAAWSNILAVGLSAIPAFLLLRRWVWGRVGNHSVAREIIPFWAYTFLGLALSTVVVAVVEEQWPSPVAVSLANLAAFGALWVTKFLLLERWMFADRAVSE